MRYIELMVEGRDAPLYHGAGFGAALSILKDNAIAAKTQHDGAKLTLSREPQEPVFGVSLTRSMAIALDFGSVVFEIDQRRLTQTHKLVPLDYWSAGNPRQPSKRGHSPRTPADKYEYEEFCIGPIAPLSRTLLALHMSERSYQQCLKTASLTPLATHPLLKVNKRAIDRFPAIRNDDDPEARAGS